MSRTTSCGWLLALLLPLLGGCATNASIGNQPRQGEAGGVGYGLGRDRPGQHQDAITVAVAFSGGGARASALAYGVLLELRDTRIPSAQGEASLLAEVDAISAVSGGSLTAAYYGLHGAATFPGFEHVVLRQDLSAQLMRRVFNPLRWFTPLGRTSAAADLYDRTVFKGARFADLQARNAPLVIINASDLENGTRFSFLQGYFDLLCSDLLSYRLADAVAASSAVPVMFEPVVLENYAGCVQPPLRVAANTDDSPQLQQAAEGLQSYADKQARHYIHLADGGLTDNLGLRAFQESIDLAGGLAGFLRRIDRTPGAHMVLISVDASGNAAAGLGLSREAPSITQAINTMTDVQLHRYNAATLELMQESMQRWTTDVSTPARAVRSHLVALSLREVSDPQLRARLQAVPTGSSLTPLQVDELVAAGRSLLRDNPSFRELLRDLRGNHRAD